MYESYYGLKGKPFQLTPDHRFFYKSKGHSRAMAYLRYGLRQGEGFIVISGGIGTGKTTLVRNLFAELGEEDVIAAQLVSTQIGAEDMLRMVCAAFDLPHADQPKAVLLTELERFLIDRHKEGKRSLLVVDEAQNLPPDSIEELRMLSNFNADGQALLQSFLLGQSELRRTLKARNMEQVRQRIIAAYHLEALSRSETQHYIQHRLTKVGWKQDPSISTEAFDLLHEFSGGVPRRINTVSDRLMLFGSLEELHQLDGSHVSSVIEELSEEISHADPDQPEPMQLTLSDESQGLGGRLKRVEEDLQELKQMVRKDRRLLRKAILLQMDMDDADE